ncbi:MAG TPA: menaquinone biosynthesis decarboxylase, partial [Bacteroidetes bacterium]|nr:menaquinone biosynthesis decarboxylase [Bacteroidota bacterium]
KFLIFLEANVDCSDIKDAIWRFTNNIDPRRDSFIIEGKEISHIAFDGTRKTKEYDGFERDWPNILAMDEKTISLVDEKWEKYQLGKFIPSPSLKYRRQLYKGGAVAE